MKAKKRWLSLLGAAIMALTVAAVPAKAAGITATANTSNVSAKVGDPLRYRLLLQQVKKCRASAETLFMMRAF